MKTSGMLLDFAKISYQSILLAIICAIFIPAKLTAREARINWIPPSTPADGYILYYKTGSSGQPYDGRGANEGDSPIDLGNRTNFTLSGLSETETYYLCIASYIATDQSNCSEEIVLPPSPPPQSGRNVHFVWPERAGTDEYRLYYKTGESGPPYNGTSANEGVSPVVSTNTSLILHGLPSTEILFFTYTRVEGTTESDPSQEIELQPSNINNPPIAQELSFTTAEDTPYSGQLSASDANQDTLTYIIASEPSMGQLQLNDNTTGDFTYVPNSNTNGNDLFRFSVNDGTYDSPPAEVSITVSAVNDPPRATPLSVSTPEESSRTIQLSASDPDGDPLTYRITRNPQKGTTLMTDPTSGVVSYTPNINVTGSDIFSFVANDGTVDSSETQVSISISPRNDPPGAEQLSFTLNEDTTLTGELQGSDPDGDTLTYSLSTPPANGRTTLTNTANGTFSYIPNEDYNGNDTFSYTVNDGQITSAPASVNLTVNSINDPPTVNNDSFSTVRNRAFEGTLSGNDRDGDSLFFSVFTPASKGTIELTDPGNGSFRYTPSSNETGEDSFTFRVTDGELDSSIGRINISISATNTAPVASKLSSSTPVNTPYTGNLPAFDNDGDQLIFRLITTGNLGTARLTDSNNGTFIYTPETDQTGEDSFSYTVNDGEITSAEGTVTISIIPGNLRKMTIGSTSNGDITDALLETFLNTSNENHEGKSTTNLSTACTTAPCPISSTVLFKVDLSHLPTYTRVENAVLHLYQISSMGNISFPATLYPIENIHPVIAEANGYSASLVASWDLVKQSQNSSEFPMGLGNIGQSVDKILLLPQEGYTSWNITGMVQNWLNRPELNNGFLITGESTEEESQRIFASSEHQNQEMRPFIQIFYSLEPPVPELIIIEER